MNAIPLINNIPKTNINNEKQLRQEINTSLVALKKEAGTLEGLINEAAQMLNVINNRIATLENNTVKKSDIVDVVQSGNLQPVTSNAVAGAIDKINYSASARNIDTLYPSENGKSEVFGGNFSGNVPESRQTAILKTFRVSSTSSSEAHIYQEWESYGASSPYDPNKYFRFGYFTGSASPTWSPWQKITVTKELNEFIKYKAVSISSITLTANGYADISSYMPSGMNNFLFAILYNYSNTSTKDALGVIGAGTYLFGTANATITNIVLRYYYFD